MNPNVEDIFVALGPFGRYQKFVFFAACLFSFSGAPTIVQDPFTTYNRDYRCYVPSCDTNVSIYEENFVDFALPSNSSGDADFQSCNANRMDNDTTECVAESFDPLDTYNCSRWIFDPDLFTSTVISDFDLVCGKSWLIPIGSSCYMAGNLLGSFIFGAFSDIFGRKRCLIICLVSFIGFGVGGAWVPSSYVLFLVIRLLTGMCGVTLFSTSFILAVEFIGAEWRTFAGMMVQVPFALGECFTGVMAYFIRDWRWLQTSIIAPAVLLIPLYWVMPESVRWLISKGRYEEARKIIDKAASVNKTKSPSYMLQPATNLKPQDNFTPQTTQLEEKKQEDETKITDILKYSKTRRRTIIMFYCWAVSSLTYYGLSSNTGNLSGNIFINFILTMLIEIPSYIFSFFSLDRIGRKGTMMFVFILAGVSCIMSGLFPEDWTTAIVSLSLIGKFGTSAAFGSIYVYTAEIYPTKIRSLAVGLCSTCARFGAILAPLIAGMGNIYKPLPLLIFGGLSLVAGFLFLFLPETYGTILPQTLEQSEKFGDDSIWSFICFKKKPEPTQARKDDE